MGNWVFYYFSDLAVREAKNTYTLEIAEIFPHNFFFLQKFRKINAFSTKYCMLVSRIFFTK